MQNIVTGRILDEMCQTPNNAPEIIHKLQR